MPLRAPERRAVVTADLVITNALVVTADAAATVIRDGAVAVTGGRIARIGTGGDDRDRGARGHRRARHDPDARADQHPLPCGGQPVSRAGRGPAAGAVAPAGVEGRGRDPEPRHGAARRHARLRRAGAGRRHHGDGHVLAPARDRGGCARGGLACLHRRHLLRRAGRGRPVRPGADGGRRGVLRRLRRSRGRSARVHAARRLHGRVRRGCRPPGGWRRNTAGSSAPMPPRRAPSAPTSRRAMAVP